MVFLPEVPKLPRGWPPLGPPAVVIDKLNDNKVLTGAELEQLREHAALAEQLEANNPDFKRTVARYRAQCVEENRVMETARAIEEKAKAVEGVRQRVKMDRETAKIYSEQKRQKRDQRSKQVNAAREAKRQELLERIAVSDRRALVRQTIERALVAQSRAEGASGSGIERSTMTAAAADSPGPGSYSVQIPTSGPTGAAFGAPPTKPPRAIDEPPAPGPGAYDPKLQRSTPAITMGGLPPVRSRRRAEQEAMPGPGAYKLPKQLRKGGTISSHVVKSEMEYALDRAREQPGPGEYELMKMDTGKSSTIGGRTRGVTDVMFAQQARRPGPDAYGRVVPRSRVRGGAFANAPRSFGPSLPAIAPGPGAYHQTPTIALEQEMRRLQKQVVRMARSTNGGGSQSAPMAMLR